MDTEIINKKLANDLKIGRVEEVAKLISPFISSLSKLVPKHNGGWRKIYHLSYSIGRLVNDHIPDNAGEMRYTWFQNVLQIVLQAERNCIIWKQDMKNAFKNNLVTSSQQWLLEFMWKEKYYKETYLSFGFLTTPFIFNLFRVGLHWILVSNLGWILVHYLDDFVVIFTAV